MPAKGSWGQGWREIELITSDDLAASRDENNPGGADEWKAVEELFQRTAGVITLTVNGREIRTTSEHPFYHAEKGWFPAGDLVAGDRLVGQYGEMVIVNKVEAGGEYEAVYNLSVADWHTYFVGDEGWGFGVSAHNASYDEILNSGARVINNNTGRKQPKVDFLFGTKHEAQQWSVKQILGRDYKRSYDAKGKWVGWENRQGDKVYWGHGDWGKGTGSSTFPHQNYELIDGTKGHLFLLEKIHKRGMFEDFRDMFGL